MIVSHRHKFVYVGPPKTGTHTMARVLKVNYTVSKIGRVHCAHWKDMPLTYTGFLTVRNPWTRLASWWLMVIREGHIKRPKGELQPPCETFAIFLRWMADHKNGDDLGRDQPDQRQPMHIFTSRLPCTRFVRLECFKKDFLALPWGKKVEVPVLNRGSTGRAVQYYDDQCVQLATEYGVVHECRAFGYPTELEAA